MEEKVKSVAVQERPPSQNTPSMSNAHANILNKIENKQAVIAVIGMGYVGLPIATTFAGQGFPVVGLDVDPWKVAEINQGRSYIKDISSEALSQVTIQAPPHNGNGHAERKQAPGKLLATSDYDHLNQADIAIICVPTPLDADGEPDVSYVISAADDIAARFHSGMLVILESTSYPGTTEEIILPRLTNTGHTVGQDFFLAFSPERIDPGNTRWRVENIPKLVGGVTPECTEAATALIRRLTPNVHVVSSPGAAEMAKLTENTFRSINIALVNELALMAEHLGLDVWEVIEAAGTKPFGFMPFQPGPGVGGHCIPVDPFFLSWKAQQHDYSTQFISLAAEVNQFMPNHVVNLIDKALQTQGKQLSGAKVLLLGVSFKPGIDDTRNSPAEFVMRQLIQEGVQASYHDPYVPQFSLKVEDGRQEFESAPISEALLADYDCVAIIVRHEEISYESVVQASRAVVDTVNATRNLAVDTSHVLQLGVGSHRPTA